MKNFEKLTCVGEIINTHGIKGELKVKHFSHNIQRFKKLDYIFIENFGIKEVQYFKIYGSMLLLKIKYLDDINDVLNFKGKKIYIKDEDRLKLPKDNYYIDQLIGKTVVDQNDKIIGEVIDVINNPANDILSILSDDSEILIPMVKDFIIEINSVIKVKIIEGMR